MNRQRLDQELVKRQLAETRSQADNFINLGQVKLNGQTAQKSAKQVSSTDKIELTSDELYVSRAGLKLASVADKFKLDFHDKTVLDVGSSTGGFTDYALQHGAAKVVAVDVGTNQLHPKLRNDKRVEVHEQTDIRNFATAVQKMPDRAKSVPFDMIVIDVSFISLRHILPAVKKLCGPQTHIVAMVKPQFETHQNENNNPSTSSTNSPQASSGFHGSVSPLNKGVIKNDKFRRDILKSFEAWVRQLFKVLGKADSAVAGAKGNQERFYLLKKPETE